jgi:methionyl-tRNA formyltransferase
MVSSLNSLLQGSLPDQPQGSDATLTRPLVKADGWLDWNQPAVELERRVRAMWSWPRAWTTIASGDPIQIHRSHVAESSARNPTVGTIVSHGDELAVQAKHGLLVVDVGQLPGGKPLPGPVLAKRVELQPGQQLGQLGRPALLEPLTRPVSDS